MSDRLAPGQRWTLDRGDAVGKRKHAKKRKKARRRAAAKRRAAQRRALRKAVHRTSVR